MRPIEGFYFAEWNSTNLWCRVVHKHPAGQETVIYDFVKGEKIAQRIAMVENQRICKRAAAL